MTTQERELMIWQIQKWISSGFNRKSLHTLIESTYDLKTYQTRNKYISEASKGLKEDLDIESIKNMLAERLDVLSEKAEEKERYDWAVKAIDSQAKLLGLTDNKKEVSIEEGDKIFKVTFGE